MNHVNGRAIDEPVGVAAGGSAVSNVFFVDAGTGGVVTMVPLDADAGVTPYTVVVRARDKGSPVRSVDQTLTINIVDENDNPPVFGATTYSAAISETNARAGIWAGLQVCLSACLPVCLSVCLSVCLPACLSVCLSVCLSLWLDIKKIIHAYLLP